MLPENPRNQHIEVLPCSPPQALASGRMGSVVVAYSYYPVLVVAAQWEASLRLFTCVSEKYNSTYVCLKLQSAFTFNSTPAAGNAAEKQKLGQWLHIISHSTPSALHNPNSAC